MIVGLAASLVVLVLAGALRSGAASLMSTARADALRDGADSVHGADTVARLLDDRPRLQSSIGMVHSAILVAAAVPAAWALTTALRGWWLAAALLGLAILVLLVGDMLPRSYGRAHPGTQAYRLSGLLSAAARFGRRAGELLIEEPEPEPEEDEEEVEERRLITSVLEFSDTLVREVMVPRLDMVTVSRDETTDAVLDIVVGQGFSRIPVVGEGPDDIVGFIYAKDLLGVSDIGPVSVTTIMRPVYFVPETKRIPDLLRDMQSRQQHMAIVVDEFGGTAGLVTIEDLLEELVGEIIDEYDTEEPLLVEHDDGGYLVDGRFSVEDLGETLGVELEHDEWDTVSGLVLDMAGRVPHVGETFEVGDVRFEVAVVQGRRVTQIRVTRS
ncbi:MAG: hemolysin family protein [Acidimicrobiia bacterium]